MTRKKLVKSTLISAVAIILLLAGLSVGCGPAAPAPGEPTVEVFKTVFASYAPKGVWASDVLYKDYCDKIEKMSGGRINIEFTAAGDVVESTEVIEGIRTGLLGIGVTSPAHYMGALPPGELEDAMPMAMIQPHELRHLFEHQGWEDILREEVYAPYGVQHLCIGIAPGSPISSRYPLTSLEDFEGLKIRALGAKVDLCDAADASVVIIAYPEIYLAMSLGTIDAATGPWVHEIEELKLYEFAKYIVMPPLCPLGTLAYVVNMDFWDSLPEDLQEQVYAAAKVNAVLTESMYDRDVAAYGRMLEEGVSYVYLDAETQAFFREAAMAQWDAMAAKDPINARMMEIFKRYMTHLGYL